MQCIYIRTGEARIFPDYMQLVLQCPEQCERVTDRCNYLGSRSAVVCGCLDFRREERDFSKFLQLIGEGVSQRLLIGIEDKVTKRDFCARICFFFLESNQLNWTIYT